MRNIIFDDMTNKERGKIDTYHRIDQIQPVITCCGKLPCQQSDNLVNHPMQHECRHSSKQTHKKGKDQ